MDDSARRNAPGSSRPTRRSRMPVASVPLVASREWLCSNLMNKINFTRGESKSSLETLGRSCGRMRISAKADYAVRAVIELAAVPGGASLNAREIATAQDIPQNFLENILA